MEILSLSSASATSEDLPGSPSGKLFTMQVVLKEKVHVRPWTHAVYVGEGAANVLFRPFLYKKVGKQQKEDGTDADLLTHYLMRVAKEPKSADKPFHLANVQFEYFWKKIVPLFDSREDMFVQVRMANIPPEAVIHLHKYLEALNTAVGPMAEFQKRPRKFVGDRIHNWCLVLLVENMLPRADDERVVEFKPKWLAQSPTAPKNANTCRCCALASRNFNRTQEANVGPERYPCPLWLDPERPTPKGKETVRQKTIARLFNDSKEAPAIYELLKKTHILTMLKRLQIEKDAHGPLRASKDDEEFSTAMTLRDCSLYMRYRIKDNGKETVVVEGSFEAKLADLDKKNADWKFAEWQEKERVLVEEGWYTGRGQMKNCALQV